MDKKQQFSVWYVLAVFFLLITFQRVFLGPHTETLAYSDFKALLAVGKVTEASISKRFVTGKFQAEGIEIIMPQEKLAEARINGTGGHAFVAQRIDAPDLVNALESAGVRFSGRTDSNWFSTMLSWVVPTFVFFGLWSVLTRRMGGAGGMMEVGKSKVKVYVEDDTKVGFSHVLGSTRPRRSCRRWWISSRTPAATAASAPGCRKVPCSSVRRGPERRSSLARWRAKRVSRSSRSTGPSSSRCSSVWAWHACATPSSMPGSDPVHKISIIPRGIGALGYTIQRPTEDRYLMTREELEGKMAVLLGGRASEHLVFGHLSTGAADDLAKASQIARAMVTRYGMDETLGHAAYEPQTQSLLGPMLPGAVGREFSEETGREIDCAVRDLVRCAFDRALALLGNNREVLESGAGDLLAHETLDEPALETLRTRIVSASVPV